MTIRSLIANYDTDVDIIDSYSDDLWIAYCGTKLTDIGTVTYSPILDLPLTQVNDCTYMVEVSTAKQHRLLKQMLIGMAGYIDDTEYNKLFYND